MRQRTTRLTVITLALALITTPVITIAASSPAAAQPELYATITQTPLNGGPVTRTTMPLATLNTEYKRDKYTIKKDNHATKELNTLTNKAREKVGLKPFKIDASLTKEAQRQVELIVKKGDSRHVDTMYWNKISPGWFDANIHAHQENQKPHRWDVGRAIWSDLMGFESSRSNILNPGYTRVGSAVLTGTTSFGRVDAFVVQVFAGYPTDPKPGKVKPKISGEVKGFTNKKVKRGTTAKWDVYVTDEAVLQRYEGKKWEWYDRVKPGKSTLKIKAPKKAGVKHKYRIVVKETYYSKKKTSKTITLTAK